MPAETVHKLVRKTMATVGSVRMGLCRMAKMISGQRMFLPQPLMVVSMAVRQTLRRLRAGMVHILP